MFVRLSLNRILERKVVCRLKSHGDRSAHHLSGSQFQFTSTSLLLITRGRNHVNQRISVNQSQCSFLQSVRCASSFRDKMISISESIGTSFPVSKCTDALIWVHDTTGLPWWFSIMVSTFIFRSLIVFPFMCYDRRITHKLINVGPEISEHTEKVAERLKKMVAFGQLKKGKYRISLMRAHKKNATRVYIENNIHPGQRVVLIAFQFPFWITMSSALNNLCVRPWLLKDPSVHEQFFTGGVSWFQNLTIPDPYYVWPAMFFASILSSIKITEIIKNQNRVMAETKLERVLMIFLKGWTVVLLGLSSFTPSGCVLYWTTSAACGTLHHYILSFPKIRRMLKIPMIKNDPKPIDWKRLTGSTQK